jgi:hypothetical protein
VDALCALLLLQALPSSALWGIGWLLLQLLGSQKAGDPQLKMHAGNPCLMMLCPKSSKGPMLA